MTQPTLYQLALLDLTQTPDLAGYPLIAQAVAGYNTLIGQVNTRTQTIWDAHNALLDWLLELQSQLQDFAQSVEATRAWHYELGQLDAGIRTATTALQAGQVPAEIDLAGAAYLGNHADIVEAVQGYNAMVADVDNGNTKLSDATNGMYDWLMEINSHLQDAMPHAEVNEGLLAQIQHLQATAQSAARAVNAYAE